jgi:uncharacterized membrane protein YhaH (DUF805 family)
MNPFTVTLTRTGFLIWSIICIVILVGFGLSIDFTKASHQGTYWIAYRLLFILFFFGALTLTLIRRLQNAGLSSILFLIVLFPGIGQILWFSLFFIPTKKRK